MYDNFNQQKHEIIMSEDERKSHKKLFSNLCFAYLAFILIANGLSIVASLVLSETAPQLLENGNFALILSSALQYCIAFPILVTMLSKIPSQAPSTNTLNAKSFRKYALASVFIMYVGNYISSFLMVNIESALGYTPENAVDTILSSSNIVLSVILIGIVGPIIEELMFRKLFIDRLTPYGELTAILIPSLIFGLFHANLYQFFYAFFLGAIFSYIYVKTGKIIYSTVLHIFINLFFGVLPAAIIQNLDYEQLIDMALAGNIPEEYITANIVPLSLLVIYEFITFALVFFGLFTFTRNVRNVTLNKGAIKFPKGTGADTVFFNAGAIILITVCLILTAVNTFAA